MSILDDPTYHAFLYFAHRDNMNSAIHMAQVKYSPITFALARKLADEHQFADLRSQLLFDVLHHEGMYALDKGR